MLIARQPADLDEAQQRVITKLVASSAEIGFLYTLNRILPRYCVSTDIRIYKRGSLM